MFAVGHIIEFSSEINISFIHLLHLICSFKTDSFLLLLSSFKDRLKAPLRNVMLRSNYLK